MTQCTDAPLAASVDIVECESPRPYVGWRRCCKTMAAPFSPFCGGCTALECGYLLFNVYAAVHFAVVEARVVSAACIGSNAVLQQAQSKKHIYQLQFLQCLLCVVAVSASAGCSTCAPLHWLLLIACIIHLGTGIALRELLAVGDCRRCMSEVHKCQCGALRDPVPPGSLAYLVSSIEANWVPLSQRTTETTD